MIPRPGNLKAVRGLEAEVARLTGDASLARRVRQATAAGRPIDTTLAKAIERAMVRRGAKSLEARNLLNWIAATQNQTLMQVTDPATLAQPLIKSGVVGWAKIPGKSEAVLVEKGTGCKVLSSQGKEIVLKNFSARFSDPRSVDKAAFIAHLRRFGFGEGEISYFYLDKKGKVTIGIGHEVTSEAAGRQLARDYLFYSATPAVTRSGENEVAKAYNIVKNSQHLTGAVAPIFEPLTTVRLDAFSIEDLFAADVEQFIGEIRRAVVFPEFATYPPTAKLAILDIVFNVGLTDFLGPKVVPTAKPTSGWPKFIDAVRNRDWATAAAQSHRGPPIDAGRNGQVRQWLLTAARSEPFFIAASARAKCPVLILDKLLKAPGTP